jgi:hypothetical protein
MPNASVIMDEAAVMMNDAAKTQYTYAAQLPYLRMALSDLEGKLLSGGYGRIRKRHADTNISVSGSPISFPSPPSDLLLPVELYEKGSGEPDSNYIEIVFCRFFPNDAAAPVLGNYTFNNDIIQFPPVTQARVVRLDYYASLTAVADETTPITLIRVQRYLASATAYLLAKYVANSPSRMATTKEDKDEADHLLFNPMIHADQAAPVRKRPYQNRL